jgi:hypothetical protein
MKATKHEAAATEAAATAATATATAAATVEAAAALSDSVVLQQLRKQLVQLRLVPRQDGSKDGLAAKAKKTGAGSDATSSCCSSSSSSTSTVFSASACSSNSSNTSSSGTSLVTGVRCLMYATWYKVEELTQQLQQWCLTFCGHFATSCCCNNPACTSMASSSEQELVGGKKCVCSRCLEARYCSRECREVMWPYHKQNCKALKRQQRRQQQQQQDDLQTQQQDQKQD